MQIYTTFGGQENLATHSVRSILTTNSLGKIRQNVPFFVLETNLIELVLGSYYMTGNGFLEKLLAMQPSVAAPEASVVFITKLFPGVDAFIVLSLFISLTQCGCKGTPVRVWRELRARKSALAEASVRAHGKESHENDADDYPGSVFFHRNLRSRETQHHVPSTQDSEEFKAISDFQV